MEYQVWSKSSDSPEWFREPECTFDDSIDAELALEDLQADGATDREYTVRQYDS